MAKIKLAPFYGFCFYGFFKQFFAPVNSTRMFCEFLIDLIDYGSHSMPNMHRTLVLTYFFSAVALISFTVALRSSTFINPGYTAQLFLKDITLVCYVVTILPDVYF